ncbi:MAG: glycoside hydrolase [Acidobacteria bacterium]|nr:glycoside hydrolase [Acidobacteriota bacterium]
MPSFRVKIRLRRAALLLALLASRPAWTAVQAEAAGSSWLEKVDVFEANTLGYAHFRIPGLVVTTKGTLLAYCEARKSTRGDWGAIDIFLRRSSDGGKTWESARKIVTPPPGASKNPVALKQSLGGSQEVTVNNPVAIVDVKSGTVHFLYCLEYMRCFYMRSDDDGRTFTEPVEITQVFEKFRRDYDWKVLATGPGHGIQLKNGRLVVPIWLSTGTGGHAHRPSCVSTIYSDDHGRSWKRGEIVVNDPNPKNPSETVVVQLADGRVMLNIRHESRPNGRGVSLSGDGAGGWSPMRFDPQLPEPVCMGSIVRLTTASKGKRNRIVFANPHNPESTERKNLTVKLSYDEGQTWPVAKALEQGLSGYSDIAAGPDGTLYCFYERGTASEGAFNPKALCMARFNLEWLTDGKDRLKEAASGRPGATALRRPVR